MTAHRNHEEQRTGLRVATWNVHRWTGSDRRRDPERATGVIQALDVDLIALQEVDPPEPGTDIAQWLAGRTGMFATAGPTLVDDHGDYGNVLLSRLPLRRVRRHDLAPSRVAWEPRGVLDVDVAWRSRRLRVLCTHLGLRGRERSRQVGMLRDLVDGGPGEADLLLGDMNEWVPFHPRLLRLRRAFRRAPLRRTFPSRAPLFPLDRAFLSPRWLVRSVRAVREHGAPLASDHLPLRLVLAER